MSVINVDAKTGSIIISVRCRPQVLFPVARVDLLRLSDNIFVNEHESASAPSPPASEKATSAEKILSSHTITTTTFKPESRATSDEVTSATSTLPRILNKKRKLKAKVSSLKEVQGKVKLKAINKTSLKNVKKANRVNHNNNGLTRVLVNVSTSTLVSQNDSALLPQNVSRPIHQNRPTLRKTKPSVQGNDAIKIKRPQNKPSASENSQVFKVSKSKKTTPAIHEANSTPSIQVNNVNTISTPSVVEDKLTDTPTSNFKGYVIPRKPKAPSPEREPSLSEDDDPPYIFTDSQPDVKGMRSPSPPVISFEGEDGYSPQRFMIDDGSNGADIGLAVLLSSPKDTDPDNMSEASSVQESPHSSPKSRSPPAEEADPPECNESQTRREEVLQEDADVLDLFSYDLGEFDF